MNKPYGFYRRQIGKNKIYYVRFRDPKTGERLSAISTKSTKKADAENFAIEYIKTGKVSSRSHLSFSLYTKYFFNYYKSSYIKNQIASGARYSETYADNNQGILKKHLIPKFGKKLL